MLKDKSQYLFQQACFVFRFRHLKRLTSLFKSFWLSILGMKIGNGTVFSSIYLTWPHQVSLGKYCTIEPNVFFKYDGIWKKEKSILIGDNVFIGFGCEFNVKKRISIGNDSLIASGCKFIDHDHGRDLNSLMRIQVCPEKEIMIGNNVWLGANVVVLKGCTIGNGAIVAAGAVVTKSIGDFEIWGGVPARKIGERK